MIQFADEALIEVSSGKGGNGCISFRREKYIPLGGPSGGDGGTGGDVVFCVKRNLRTLAHLRYKQKFKARNGGDGEGNNRYGKDGEDIVIPVPPGTVIRDAETNEAVCEFTTESEDERFVFLTGGKGGWGNMHFKSSTNQAPRYAHKGKEAQSRLLRVELSVMADIGLVGFPNAGKSSLLDYFTNARPKIAPYPFTTKIPNLGVLNVSDESDIIIADIPGIIEGASGGAGLGIRFLKHLSRTEALLYVIDCSDENYLTAFEALKKELNSFSTTLSSKPRIILCNKVDIEGAADKALEIKQKYPEEKVLPMSIYSHEGLDEVRKEIITLFNKLDTAGCSGNIKKNITQRSSSKGKCTVESFDKNFLETRSSCNEEQIQYPGSE